MQEFLYKITPTRLGMLTDGPTDHEREVTGQHFDYLSKLAAEGVVVLAGRTTTDDKDAFGIVIFRAESESAAQQIVQNDPAVKQGIMHATLYPYRIAISPDAQ